jgi:adenosylhomocysteinase
MDMSFATQALASEWAVKKSGKLGMKVYDVSEVIEEQVSRLKLKRLRWK